MEHYFSFTHIIIFVIFFLFGWIIGWLLAKKKQLSERTYLTPEERELMNYLKQNYKEVKAQYKAMQKRIKDYEDQINNYRRY